jgi:circadian clock protein KaiB
MSRPTRFKFRLYISGEEENSMQALANLQALCHLQLPGTHEIEVVDVRREPRRALTDRVLMTPTLIKLAPLPARRIVGTLDHPAPLLRVLGLTNLP